MYIYFFFFLSGGGGGAQKPFQAHKNIIWPWSSSICHGGGGGEPAHFVPPGSVNERWERMIQNEMTRYCDNIDRKILSFHGISGLPKEQYEIRRKTMHKLDCKK